SERRREEHIRDELTRVLILDVHRRPRHVRAAGPVDPALRCGAADGYIERVVFEPGGNGIPPTVAPLVAAVAAPFQAAAAASSGVTFLAIIVAARVETPDRVVRGVGVAIQVHVGARGDRGVSRHEATEGGVVVARVEVEEPRLVLALAEVAARFGEG